jgi:hypothetical protein
MLTNWVLIGNPKNTSFGQHERRNIALSLIKNKESRVEKLVKQIKLKIRLTEISKHSEFDFWLILLYQTINPTFHESNNPAHTILFLENSSKYTFGFSLSGPM